MGGFPVRSTTKGTAKGLPSINPVICDYINVVFFQFVNLQVISDTTIMLACPSSQIKRAYLKSGLAKIRLIRNAFEEHVLPQRSLLLLQRNDILQMFSRPIP